MISSKYNDDLRLNNEDFAKIGGVTRTEMHLLEIDFLVTVQFNLWVTEDSYTAYLHAILDVEKEEEPAG